MANFRNITYAISPLVNKVIRSIMREIARIAYPLNKCYTPLAILLLFICGSIAIYAWAYIFKYNRYDFWLWKTRAIFKIITYTLFLVITKIILMELAK